MNYRMDRRLPKLSKQPACVNCGHAFAFRDRFLCGPKSPLLLHCGHSVCESCIRSILRNKDAQLVCRTCSEVSEITSPVEDFALREEFPLNLYLLGKIQFQAVMRNDDSMITFKRNKQSQNSSALDPSRKDMCCECNRITADARCQQCNVIYCNLCFDKVHRAAKSLQMHKKEPLSQINKTGTEMAEFCSKHGDQKLEFYCPNCDTIVCAYCVISDHMNHGAISLKEKNAGLREELIKSLDEAAEVLRRLQFTQKKAVTSCKKTDVSGTAVVIEQAIQSHFSYLHGCLQLQEARLLAKLKQAQSFTANSLQNVTAELEISIKETEEAIAAGKAVCGQNVPGNIDFNSVIENLKRLKNIPCHLYFSEASKKQEAYRFSATPGINKTLEEHCQLTLPDNSMYVLKTEDELPDNYVLEKLPDVSSPKKVAGKKPVRPVEHVPERRRNSASQSSDRSESSRTSLNACKNSVSAVHDLQEGVTEQVIICHLTSPSEFYVHRKGCALELINFTSQFKTYVSVREDVPGAVEIGNIYLVKYKMDNNWYRARVTAAVDSEQFEVFYIDYGNKEVTSITNMRSIPERFLRVPPLALRCSLFGCVPVGGKWSTEAINIMVNITSDTPVTMVVMSCRSPTHCEVDLCRLECGILSFRDALVFLELATLSETSDYPMPKVEKVEFFTDVDLKTGNNFRVKVSAVNSPGDFYVQIVNNGDNFLHNLMQKMNDAYKVGGSGKSDLIYSPKVGMAVAALSSEDNKWYRAKVIRLAGKRMVEVFFVDSGNTEVVFWTDLRILHNEFLRLSKQAVHCMLSDVSPITGTEWSTKACEAFRMMVSKEGGISLVVGEAVATGKSKVILYERYDEVDVCINAYLVKAGYARSAGINSTVVEFNRVTSHDSEARAVTPASKTASRPAKKIHARGTAQEVDRVNNKTRKQERVTSTSSSLTDDESSSLQTDNDAEDIFRLPVSILHVTSPGRFFITIPSLEQQIKKLTEEMNEFYSRSSSSNVTWKKDAKCAVFRYSDMNWYRGIVLEVLSDEKIKVMLKDIAAEETVNKESVQILDPKFCDVRDGAILCHLSKIKAPGGNDKWPGIACEEFSNEIAKYQKLYISKTGDVDNGSLPIELWAKQVMPAGPLDPIVEEWITLNQYLLNKGYALPDKSYEREQPTTSAADFMKHLSEAKSISVEKAIVNWLDQSYQTGRNATPIPTDTNKFLAAIDRSATPTPCNSHHGEDDDRQSVVSNLQQPVASTSARQRSGSEMNAISDWLPPVPFKELQFEANPTYVDDDCCIYLQDPRQSKPTLEILEKALMSRYSNSKPSPSDMYWFPGQLCIAQFHRDLKWYRAKVLSVNSEDSTVKVYFVDYGNVEICKATELRKNICMGHIPVQCHKCTTDGIIPISEDGKWPTETLDFIHATIVEKPCFVELREPASPDGCYVVMSLKCNGGLDLVELLMSMHYATYVIDCDAIGGHSSKHDDDDGDDEHEDDVIIVKQSRVPSLAWYRVEQQMVSSKSDLSFIPMTLADDVSELVVEATAIVSSTEYVVNLAATDHPVLSEMQRKYNDVFNTMQEDAPKQPVLRKPYLGKACCAQFTDDGKWYRAVVISEEKDKLQVQYIDYGNIETLPLEQVKQIRNEWVSDVPAQGILCVLSDVTVVRPFNTDELKRLTKCILDCSLVMKIKSHAPSCVYVELYNLDGQLAYQPLLDANLFAQSKGTSN